MNKLKGKRVSTGFSQDRLASETGISLAALQSYEQGKRNINKASAETVLTLCKVLKCNPEEILNQEESL